MQPGKNIKILLNYFLGPILFCWLAFSIYRQISLQPQLRESWLNVRASFSSHKILYLVLAILLIPVNWGLEARKWQVSLRKVCPLNFSSAFKAVLSGVSVSVTMPNRVGEYFGRMLYIPEGSRLKTISVTVVGSFAQLLVTLLVGLAGMIALKHLLIANFPGWRIWYQFSLYGLAAVAAFMLLAYYRISAVSGIFKKWLRLEKYAYLFEALHQFPSRLLTQMLLLSFCRYLVFMLQYFLVFHFFGVSPGLEESVAVMSIVFLAMAIIPSIALLEVGLRNEVSIQLMSLYSANTLGISLSSVSVWFLNLIVPAIAGSILIFSLRIFKKRNPVA